MSSTHDEEKSFRRLAKSVAEQVLTFMKATITKALLFIKKMFAQTLQPRWMRLPRPVRDATCISAIVLLFLFGLFLNALGTMEINTYYYSYSTIAQSLASAFAFLVAVALYRMESLERDVENALNEVLDQCTPAGQGEFLRRKNKCHDWEDIETYVTDTKIELISDNELKGFISTNWRYFKEGKQKLRDLKTKLVQTLLLTSVVIGSSIALIPLSRLLGPDQSTLNVGATIALVLLVVIIFYTCRCLRNYWDIAKRLTERKPRNIYATLKAEWNTGAAVVTAEVRRRPEPQNESSPPVV